jgi:two-component system response regulator RstA
MATRITLGNLTIDRDRYDVWVGERRVDLTFVEFELLFLLARNAGKVVPRQRIFEAIWGDESERDPHKLTVHISRLRKKITASRPWKIQTVKKRGYALMNPSTAPRPALFDRQGSPESQPSAELVAGGG